MVTKELENIMGNKVTQEGFFNNGKWYYLGKNKKTEEYPCCCIELVDETNEV